MNVSLRDDIVANARWGAANEPQIHYSQAAGRMSAVHTPRALPLYTDCSGFATLCYAWAGAPDPNGRGYDGTGFTGTLLDHLAHVSSDELQPGDLVVFGPYPGDHVVIVVDTGGDPLTVSHGQEAGPILIRLSVEAKAHRAPIFYLRGLDNDTPTPPQQEDDLTPDQAKMLEDLSAAVGRIEEVIRGDGTPDGTLAAHVKAVDDHVGEARRNIRRIGTAVKATGIEGTA